MHHLAIATRNFARAHEFYTEAMGFRLVKAVKRHAMGGAEKGWTKHVFYETGSGSTLFALWDLHLADLEGKDWNAAISAGLGLPWWVNHYAFDAGTLERLEEKKQLWLRNGLRVDEVDHDFIRSIYTFDPDRNLVEWTVRTRPLNDQDRIEAEQIIGDDTPATIPEYAGQAFFPEGYTSKKS
ncbi:VOC family protein [Sphingomonas sp. YL-JM2C]